MCNTDTHGHDQQTAVARRQSEGGEMEGSGEHGGSTEPVLSSFCASSTCSSSACSWPAPRHPQAAHYTDPSAEAGDYPPKGLPRRFQYFSGIGRQFSGSHVITIQHFVCCKLLFYLTERGSACATQTRMDTISKLLSRDGRAKVEKWRIEDIDVRNWLAKTPAS